MYYASDEPFTWVIYGLHNLYTYFMSGAKFILEFVFMKIEPPALIIDWWHSALNAPIRAIWNAFGFADPTEAFYPVLIMTGYGFAIFFSIAIWKWLKGIIIE